MPLRAFAWAVVIVSSSASLLPAQEEFTLTYPTGLRKMRIPRDNPLTAEKVSLGKQLYFDKRLSSDNTISCASCHDPKKGWSNGEAFATGVDGQVGGRSAPTIINSGYSYFQFWDGRAVQLEGQALGPIQNPIEMNLSLDDMVARLNSIDGYRSQFQSVFGTDATADGVAKAIASFERTILSGNAPYDRYKAGDETALSAAAARGMALYFNKAHCSACHGGHNFSDAAFHNIGVGYDADAGSFKDEGRFASSGMEGDRGAFRTPTLRDIRHSAPYMHDGSLKTLKEVVAFYNKGGEPNAQLDEEIFPLKLTEQEQQDLVQFLKEGLSSSQYPAVDPPSLPE